MKISLALVLPVLAATAALIHVPKATAELKPVSTASCQRYFKGFIMEPEKLQFFAEGIRNVSSTPQYVICPLPKSGKAWTSSTSRKIAFYFHRDDPSAAPASAIACSLNVGSNMNIMGMNTKIVAAKPYAMEGYVEVLFDKQTGPQGTPWDSATAICVIAPKYTFEYIHFEEA